MISDLAQVLYRLAQSGASGRRPRMLEATVIGGDATDGYTITGLSGSTTVQYGIKAASGVSVSTNGQRVRIQAIGTDHTIVAAWND